MKKHLLVSAVALVDVEGHVLLGKRPKGKHMADKWEFPGGKVEVGETPEQALIRELREELDIGVEESCLAPFTFITHEYEEFTLLLLLYLCRKWNGTVKAVEYEHIQWCKPREMAALSMPPADRPLVAMLRDYL